MIEKFVIENCPAAAQGLFLQLLSLENKEEYLKDRDLYLIHVPKNANADLVDHTFSQAKSHLLVILEKGASAHITETLTDAVQSHGVEIFLDDDALLTFLSLQNSTARNIEIIQRSRIGANAKLQWQNMTLGGSEVHHDLVSEVAGAHAESSVDWVFYAKGDERQELSARNIFSAEHGGGEISIKGVAEEKAYTRCDGMIDIGLEGGGTDTYLTEDVLMLDKTVKVDAVPGLEIKTNDVKASHSATVSRVTPEDLFYFGSRGIPEAEARHMYVRGFLGDLTQKIASEDHRRLVLEGIEQKYRL